MTTDESTREIDWHFQSTLSEIGYLFLSQVFLKNKSAELTENGLSYKSVKW